MDGRGKRKYIFGIVKDYPCRCPVTPVFVRNGNTALLSVVSGFTAQLNGKK